MKKSYKRLLIYEFFISIILILNSFVSNILNDYIMILFLLICALIFKICFGFEKDKHRYIKDTIMEILINLIGFYLLYYLFGLIIGFAKTNNYYTIYSIFKFIIPLILTIILKEYLRYMILVKSEGCKLLTITTCLLFIFLDISGVIYYEKFINHYESFLFVALTLIPAISTNIACTYITKKAGYKPVIVYLLITELYRYLIPIVPNPNEYLASIINLLLPAFIGFKVYKFFLKDLDNEVERKEKKHNFGGLIIPTGLIVFLVYITSGYFQYYALAIASGSMEPKINKGDAVIIKKLDGDFAKLKEGQVIAYKYDDVTIVHRLTRIIKVNDEYFFYTKGDANSDEDNYVINEDMIIGTVSLKIPYIGIPTVWLYEL